MKPGNKFTFQILLLIFSINNIFAQDQITTSPLINLDQIEPSFEESNERKEDFKKNKTLKTKKQKNLSLSSPHAVLMGLDKITAKSSKIVVNINEIEKFGPLEIKILKCGIIKENNKQNNVAYMQVKDLTKTENEKVFIFNGWTFSSNPSMTPFDHAIYDLQLLSCNNV